MWGNVMERICRLYALQCFEWAAKIEDPSQHLIFTDVARRWLDVARKVKHDPTVGPEIVAERLH
jgi:hypothetical protein